MRPKDSNIPIDLRPNAKGEVILEPGFYWDIQGNSPFYLEQRGNSWVMYAPGREETVLKQEDHSIYAIKIEPFSKISELEDLVNFIKEFKELRLP